jgi:hypothetical protein
MRWYRARHFCFLVGALFAVARVPAQETQSESDPPGTRANETAEQRETLEQCATVPGAIDVSVLDDRHVYIRTRGSNHYLLTTEQCDRLYTAYLRTQVQLVPYGRRLCRNDGSYLRYVDGGRPRNCYIENVQRVENRAAARELAAGRLPAVEFEPVELEPDELGPDGRESESATEPDASQSEQR